MNTETRRFILYGYCCNDRNTHHLQSDSLSTYYNSYSVGKRMTTMLLLVFVVNTNTLIRTQYSIIPV